MFHITGDTHWTRNSQKLRTPQFKNKRKKMSKENDFVIICGDFGLIWKNTPDNEEIYWTNYFNQTQYTTLFVDGNHENHDRLNDLPIVDFHGGKAGKVSDSVYHLRRGEVYEILGRKILAFGGAQSHEKSARKEGKNWWSGELPTNDDLDNAFKNLERHNFEVDFVLSHTCPLDLANVLKEQLNRPKDHAKANDPTCTLLQDIANKTKFTTWYFGHWHHDRVLENINGKSYTALYHGIKEV